MDLYNEVGIYGNSQNQQDEKEDPKNGNVYYEELLRAGRLVVELSNVMQVVKRQRREQISFSHF